MKKKLIFAIMVSMLSFAANTVFAMDENQDNLQKNSKAPTWEYLKEPQFWIRDKNMFDVKVSTPGCHPWARIS